MKYNLANITIISTLILCGSYVAYAQTAPDSLPAPLETDIISQPSLPSFNTPAQTLQIVQLVALSAEPSSPSPGQSVTVQADTPTTDPDRNNFTWTIDGVARPEFSGLGKNTFTYTAGPVGSVKRVSVRVQPINDQAFSSSLNIYTTDLVLTWTAGTFVPKWYKGKALPIVNSKIRMVALPTFIVNGAQISASRLIYTWNVDGDRVSKGVGKQVYEFEQPNQTWATPTILVTIEDAAGKIHKEARMGMISQQPHAVIYQSLPLGGIEFRRGTAAFPSMAPGIVDLEVEPFFFNV
ncbi:MAG: hypothetical protein U1A23_01175, partial [Candidatus Sungbacteria bacterium]|nr:hypothetical protein [Candidatus Sungbacteria bacterium]